MSHTEHSSSLETTSHGGSTQLRSKWLETKISLEEKAIKYHKHDRCDSMTSFKQRSNSSPRLLRGCAGQTNSFTDHQLASTWSPANSGCLQHVEVYSNIPNNWAQRPHAYHACHQLVTHTPHTETPPPAREKPLVPRPRARGAARGRWARGGRRRSRRCSARSAATRRTRKPSRVGTWGAPPRVSEGLRGIVWHENGVREVILGISPQKLGVMSGEGDAEVSPSFLRSLLGWSIWVCLFRWVQRRRSVDRWGGGADRKGLALWVSTSVADSFSETGTSNRWFLDTP